MDKKELKIITEMETKTTKVRIEDQYKSIDEYLKVMNDYFNLVSKMNMDIVVYILKENGCNALLFSEGRNTMTVSELEEVIQAEYENFKNEEELNKKTKKKEISYNS